MYNELMKKSQNGCDDGGFSPQNGFVFDTHTDLQNGFISKIKRFGVDNAIEWLNKVRKNKERTFPRRLLFKWAMDGSAAYTLEISETEDFNCPLKVRVRKSTCYVGNFKVDGKYFWRVNGGEIHYFYTKANFPRFIKINGAHNVRDMGSEKIKQGLIYRGSEFDEVYPITKKGLKVFNEELKIKTELDLRGIQNDKTTSLITRTIKRASFFYRPYKEIFEERHKKTLCEIMNIFADENNYPVYIHCVGGADRTGMVAMYLRAIVGENAEDIYRDYELTGLSNYALGLSEGATGFRSRHSEYFTEFVSMMKELLPESDGSLNVLIVDFLKYCGVSENTIVKIRNIIKK